MLPLLLIFPLLVVAEDRTQNKTDLTENGRGLWVSEILPLAMSKFYPQSRTNEDCNFQGLLYKQHLSNLTLWAVQMLDSSSLSESGIVSGSDYNFGNFDQCVRIRLPEYNLYGKHCMANLRFSPLHFNDTPSEHAYYTTPGPFSSVWNKVKRVKDPRIKYRDNFYWTVCIPSGCTYADLEDSLRKTLIPIFHRNNITVNITVNETDCEEANASVKLSYGTVAYLFVMGGLVLTALIATFTHHFVHRNEEKSTKDNILLMFSLIKNGHSLFEPERRVEFQFLSGVKVLSMVCIIYGHRMLTTYAFPLLNSEDHEERVTKITESINLSGTVIVNTFLHLTGFLMFTKLINDMIKKRSINIPQYIFYKWGRTTPVYVSILCLIVFIKPLSINEPLWRSKGLMRYEACKQNLWTHVLYINNYYDPSAECLLPAWYMAVDMQMFILCVITGYIMSKYKRVGYILLGLLLTASLIIPTVVIYYKGYEPILKLYLNFLRNYQNEKNYVEVYIPTHMRAAPYLYGMATAIAYHKLQKNEFKFSKWQLALVALTTTILLSATLLSSWIFYMPDRTPSTLETIFYPVIRRTVWSLGISFIIIGTLLKGYGIVKSILGCSIFIPLNKLTFCVLLIHPLIQAQSLLSQRRPSYVDTSIILWMAAGDVISSYIISIFFHLIIEAPLAQVLDHLCSKLFLKQK